MKTRRDGSGYGSGLRMTALTTLKMAVFAPIPSASVSMVTSVYAGLLRRCRTA